MEVNTQLEMLKTRARRRYVEDLVALAIASPESRSQCEKTVASDKKALEDFGITIVQTTELEAEAQKIIDLTKI